MKAIGITEWYGLLCDPVNAELGQTFLQEMGELMKSNIDEHNKHAQVAVSYLTKMFEAHYFECRALIGFILTKRETGSRFDDASLTAFVRHNIAGQMTLLSWAGQFTEQEDCKRRIREVCNEILSLVGRDSVHW